MDGISRRGGTILYTARSEEFRTDAGVEKAANVCKYLGIDGVIALGGDGTFRGALALARHGVRVVGIPATIDNDMGCTEYTIGFDTACNTAMEAIDKLRDTGQSHERVSVVEVMGRNAGHLALYTGIAAGASAVLLPEKEINLERDVVDVIRRGCIRGRRPPHRGHCRGRGPRHPLRQRYPGTDGTGDPGHCAGLYQAGRRAVCPGPDLGGNDGPAGHRRLKSGEGSRVIVSQNGQFFDMDIEEALKMEKGLDEEMFIACNRIDTSYYNNGTAGK